MKHARSMFASNAQKHATPRGLARALHLFHRQIVTGKVHQ